MRRASSTRTGRPWASVASATCPRTGERACARRAFASSTRRTSPRRVSRSWNADGERASARQNRLGEARPTVPDALSWLMLVAVLTVLAVLSTASSGAAGPIIQGGIVLVAAAAFASTLLLISDLDQPYAGALRRDPTQTEFVRDQIAAEVRGALPCDSSGLPNDDPGFRQATAPLG